MISRWHEDAAQELRAEIAWLDRQSAGLGSRLLADVRSALRLVEEFPELGTRRQGCRRFLLSKFPFDLVYSIEGSVIVVLALAHHRRRPGYWKERQGP
jgi:toxin ParE1/3/4